MYVILFFDKWDDEHVDCVIGPFDTLDDARDWYKKNWSDKGTGYQARYRKTSTQKLTMTIPEWAE